MDTIRKETFQRMPISSKLEVVFDILTNHCENVEKITTKLDKLERLINGRKRIDTTVAGALGFVGGAVAYVGQKIFKF